MILRKMLIISTSDLSEDSYRDTHKFVDSVVAEARRCETDLFQHRTDPLCNGKTGQRWDAVRCRIERTSRDSYGT